MEENGHLSDKELIRRLLEERDELYRQNRQQPGREQHTPYCLRTEELSVLLLSLTHIHEYDHDLSLDLADFLPDNLKEAGVL